MPSSTAWYTLRTASHSTARPCADDPKTLASGASLTPTPPSELLKPSKGAAVRDHRNAVRDRSESLSAINRNPCPQSPESAIAFGAPASATTRWGEMSYQNRVRGNAGGALLAADGCRKSEEEFTFYEFARSLRQSLVLGDRPLEDRTGNVSRDITGPALNRIERDHPPGTRILTVQQVLDDGLLIGLRFVGLAVRAAQRTEVVKDDVHRGIVR